jgi:hypothetical protein
VHPCLFNKVVNQLKPYKITRNFFSCINHELLGSKRDEVTGKWRRIHNKELYALYSSPNTTGVIKSMRLIWAGHVARMEERRDAYRVLVRKPEGRKSRGRPRPRL